MVDSLAGGARTRLSLCTQRKQSTSGASEADCFSYCESWNGVARFVLGYVSFGRQGRTPAGKDQQSSRCWPQISFQVGADRVVPHASSCSRLVEDLVESARKYGYLFCREDLTSRSTSGPSNHLVRRTPRSRALGPSTRTAGRDSSRGVEVETILSKD